LAALVCAASVAAIAASTATAGAKTECNTFYSNTTLKGGVVVNEGDFCVLNNVTVTGGMTVNGSAFDTFVEIENSTIKGGLSINGAFLIVNASTINGGWSITGSSFSGSDFCGNNVDGGLSVSGVDLSPFTGTFAFGEANAGCAGGTINGGATLTNNNDVVEVDSYTVNGGLTITGNTGITELEGTTVNGTATCQAGTFNDGDGGPNSFTGQNNGCPA
jgi:hypothetical protein